jgi:hypothetical protein
MTLDSGVKVEDLRSAMRAMEQAAIPAEPVYVYAHPNQYAEYCEWFGSNNVRLIDSIPTRTPHLRVVRS